MHRLHVPIQELFWAAYLVATHYPHAWYERLATSAPGRIGSYDTAWHMLHCLRKGMVHEDRTRL